ncbi:hypothetical protein LSTR_LSTR000278 [Laodelphax striatellus]|uniref:C2H2-type domain-containing protein n=1 Tax=Laodelphax striatellus TaxID=195883 RepID=A0A482X708_LAOST|nr:hypothetical protein LSTR_LSTR000278 [Laodelphax striatellus]
MVSIVNPCIFRGPQMSNDGVSSDLELNSAELEEDSNSSSKFKCSLSSDSAPLIMGLNSDYCNNGVTNSVNLGFGLLQNLDETNLFHGDVYEWIEPKRDSESIVDLENSKIECLGLSDKIVTSSELTSPKNDNADIETEMQIGSVYTLSPNLTLQTQTDTPFLEELSGFQSDPTKEDTLSESVFLHLSPIDNDCKNLNSSAVSLDSLELLSGDENNIDRNDVRLPKSTSALPYIKIPKKLIRSGKILKKENYKSFGFLKAIQQTSISTNEMEAVTFEPNTAIIDVGSNTNLQLFSTDEINDTSEIVMFPVDSDNQNITLVSNTMSSVDETPSVHSDLVNMTEEKPSKAVVAISTDKLEDRTEIVIKTEIGEEQYIGKASDILKATNSLSNFCLKLESQDSLLDESKEETELPGILVEINPEDHERKDGPTCEEEPVTEALRTLGIVPNEKWETKSGSRNNWSCPVQDCDHGFSKLSALKIHILTHFKIKPFKCHYEGCSWSFYTSFRLKRHLTTHLKKKEYKCDSCCSSFTTIYNLSTHLKLHDRPANIVCTVEGCDKAFQTRRKLEIHLKEHGSEHAPHACDHPDCSKRFYSMNALLCHQRVHQHDIGDLQCEFCQKIFDKPCRLIAHIRCHTGVKPYTCNFEGCNWSFTSSSKLSRHQTKHTQERKFFCDVCPKAFLRSEHLKDHQRTHYVSKAFECPVEGCGFTFAAKSSLYVHMKKHRTNGENKDTCLNKPENKKRLEDDSENCNNTINLLVMNPLELWPDHEPGLYTIEGADIEGVETQVQWGSCVAGDASRLELTEEHDNQNIAFIVSTEDANSLNITESSFQTTEDVPLSNNDSEESSCARTYLKCQDLDLNRYHVKKKSKKKHLSTENQQTIASSSLINVKKPEFSDVQVVSDIVLTTSLLGGSQDNLMGLQMLQDDPTSGSTDWYGNASDDSPIILPGSVGEFHQVFLLESPLAIHTAEFEPSTINLKDLE